METQIIVIDDHDNNTISSQLKCISFPSTIDQIFLNNLQGIANIVDEMNNKTNKSVEAQMTVTNDSDSNIMFDCFKLFSFLSIIYQIILINL